MSRSALTTAVVIAAAALCLTACGRHAAKPSPVAAPAVSATSAAPTPPPPVSPAASPTARTTPAGSIPGTLFYSGIDGGNYSRGRTRILSGEAGLNVEPSPDGRQIAYVDHGGDQFGDLEIKSLATGKVRKLRSGVRTFVYGPSWSPDGKQLLIAVQTGANTFTPATIRVSDARVTYLPKNIRTGWSYRWSGDGRQLFWVDDNCSVGHASVDLKIADAGSSSARTVPVIGDPQNSRNPDRTAACVPVSVDPTGRRITAPLQSVGGAGDVGTPPGSVVDTSTGEVLPMPVTGTLQSANFGPDGNLLIRTYSAGHQTLTVVTPDGRLLVRAREPDALKTLEVVGYTR